MARVNRVPISCGGYVHYYIDVSIKDRDWKEYSGCLKIYEDMKFAGIREDKAFFESGLGKFIEDRCSQSRAHRSRKFLCEGTEEILWFVGGDYVQGWFDA